MGPAVPDGADLRTTDERARLARQGMAPAWWAARAPQRAAVVSASGERTFAELNGQANRLARALRRRGLVAGDAVALLCGNRPEFADVLFACQRAGFRLTPVNWHLQADEVGYIVGNCEAKVLVTDDPRTEVALAAAGSVDAPPVVVVVGAPRPGTLGYEALTADEDGRDLPDPVPGSVMLYTSGTTGRPKGVHRPPGTAPSATAPNLFGYRGDGTDHHLCTGPLYHAAPLAFSLTLPLNAGATVVLMEQWDAEEALRLIERHGITHTHMVPTMFHRLLALPPTVRQRYDLSSLRSVLHGAAPCPVTVKRRLIEWLGEVVWEYYAATEGVGTFVDSATWLARPGTVGRPLVDGQIVVGDEEGRPLPPGETGLVYLKAPPGAAFVYYKDPQKTAAAYTPAGDYFTLGDVGHIDDEGYLYLTDRSADLIISGGVNVYPAEVDAVLLEHPAVADAGTIGLPDPEWGEVVTAVVELRPGTVPSADLDDELRQHCRARLAHFKCPRRVIFVDELPRHDNGKLYRRLLRERFGPPARPAAERPVEPGPGHGG